MPVSVSIDGLLAPLHEDEHDWLRPPLEPDADIHDVRAAAVLWFEDVRSTLRVVWPACSPGMPRRPPDAHLLSELVRRHVVESSGDIALTTEASLRPNARTIAVAGVALPPCEACGSYARYADETGLPAGSSLSGRLCAAHFDEHGPSCLGDGIAQYLVTWQEVGPVVRAAFTSAVRHWAGRGFAVPACPPWE